MITKLGMSRTHLGTITFLLVNMKADPHLGPKARRCLEGFRLDTPVEQISSLSIFHQMARYYLIPCNRASVPLFSASIFVSMHLKPKSENQIADNMISSNIIC